MSAQPLEARLAHLEGAFVQVGERLNSIDRRLDSMDQRFGRLEQALDARFSWLMGIVVGTWITTILTVLFHR